MMIYILLEFFLGTLKTKTFVKLCYNKHGENMKKGLLLIIVLLILEGCAKPSNSIAGSKQINSCPNCVFSYDDRGLKYGEKGSTLKEYTNDYTTLKNNKDEQRRYFLGSILDDSGKIIRGFACGILNEVPFCLEGTNDGSKYETNIDILKSIYGEDKCEEFEDYIVCRDTLIAGTNKNGNADVGIEGACMAISNNTLVCN